MIDESVDSVEDEVLQGKIANVIALAINHIKDDDSEECYTQEELVSALREQVSALQDGSAQDSVVRAVIWTCQCEAHETIQDMNSPIREFVVKLLDIAVTESQSPNIENQLGELVIGHQSSKWTIADGNSLQHSQQHPRWEDNSDTDDNQPHQPPNQIDLPGLLPLPALVTAVAQLTMSSVERVLNQHFTSLHTVPMVLAKKRDGTLWVYVDYRCLNAVSRADAYPMAQVEDLVNQLGRAKYISTLD